MSIATQFFNNINISFKYLRGNPWRLSLILVFPIIAISLPVTLIPLRYSFSTTILFATIIPAAIMFISITFVWKNGTLYKNTSVTSASRIIFYASTFLFLTIAVSILLFLTFVVLSILSALDLLIPTYWWNQNGSSSYYYKLWSIDFIALFYTMFEAMIITISLCIFVQSFTKNTAIMYNFLIGLMILMILFGGGFNFFFNDTSGNIIDEHGNITRNTVFTADDAFFPLSTYWFNTFFPYFAPGQHLSNLASSMMYVDGSSLEGAYAEVINPNNIDGLIPRYENQFWYWQNRHEQLIYLKTEEIYTLSFKEAFMWNSLWFQTYIWVLVLLGGTTLINHTKKNNL